MQKDMISLLGIRKMRRQDLAAILAGMAGSSFCCHYILWLQLMRTQPRKPDHALGLIYPMNNHGWYYYLSAIQATQLNLLVIASVALIILASITNGRFPIKMPWEKYSEEVVGNGWYILISFLISAVIVWYSTPYVASYMVFKGFILNPW